MAKIRSSRSKFSLGGTALEDFITSITQGITQPEIDTTCLGDAGPRSLIDNYKYTYALDGHADFAAGASDATLFGLVGDEDGAATVFQPTGAAAGADDPNYTGGAVLTSLNITSRVGSPVDYSAQLSGRETLLRAVA
jgi:hypothetical protein